VLERHHVSRKLEGTHIQCASSICFLERRHASAWARDTGSPCEQRRSRRSRPTRPKPGCIAVSGGGWAEFGACRTWYVCGQWVVLDVM